MTTPPGRLRFASAPTSILQDLAKQASDATTGHAQASNDLTPEEAQQIVVFEAALFSAQTRDAGNGAAATLEEAVEFYETCFSIRLTAQGKADLVAFLRSL